jgi:hypothetical protein
MTTVAVYSWLHVQMVNDDLSLSFSSSAISFTHPLLFAVFAFSSPDLYCFTELHQNI